MNEAIGTFGRSCRSLPKSLKEWDAYKELYQEISDFTLVLPLLKELSKPSIK